MTTRFRSFLCGWWVLGVACSQPTRNHAIDAPPSSDAATFDAAYDASIDAYPGIRFPTGDPIVAVDCMLADASHVYWSIGFTPSYVLRAPIGGGSVEMVATDPVHDACVQALDATNVYWIDGAELVESVPLSGGATVQWWSNGLGSVATNGLDVAMTWLNSEGEIQVLPVAGGSSTTIGPGVYSIGDLAEDSTYIYFRGVVSGAMSVMRVPITSIFDTTPEIVFTVDDSHTIGGNLGAPYTPYSQFAVDANNVYLIEIPTSSTGDGAIVQIPLGGGPTTTLVDNVASPIAIAVDSTDVYWSSSDGGSAAVIQRTPIGGGPITTIATGVSGTFALAPTSIAYSVPGFIDVIAKP